MRLVVHKGEWGGGEGGGGEHSHVHVVVHCCLSHSSHCPRFVNPSCCGYPLSLPHHIIIVHLSPLLLHGHHQVLLSTPRVAEGEGVMWRWVLRWPLGVVAARQEKEGGRALLTCPMHAVIAIWMTWHIPRGSLRSSPCAVNQAGTHCCRCGWCVCVCWPSSTWGGSRCVLFSPWWALTMQGGRHEGWWVMGMVVEGKWCLYLVLSCVCVC